MSAPSSASSAAAAVRFAPAMGSSRASCGALEDIAALTSDAGGSAHLYGVSSGGALALEATRPASRSTDWPWTAFRPAWTTINRGGSKRTAAGVRRHAHRSADGKAADSAGHSSPAA
jgi:hypothetical protein